MSKVAVITDTHLGMKGDSEVFLESQLKFFRNTFLRTLKEQGINTVIHLGDAFDQRSKMGINTLNAVIDLFQNDFKDLTWYILVGNHDAMYRNTLEVSSLRILHNLPNVNIINKITSIEFFGKKTLLVPWQINHEDFKVHVESLKKSHKICMGHFPINGFLLNSSKVCVDEISPDIFFDNFEITLSGHFHNRDLKKRGSSKILYIGNPFHKDRGDSNSKRGFAVFDFETLKYDFIDNEDSIKYIKIKYPEDYSKVPIEGNIIDVEYIYNEDSKEETFQEYLRGISERNPLYPPYPKRINNSKELLEAKDVEIESKNNKSILLEYISKVSLKDNTKDILERVEELYNTCSKGDITNE